MKAHTAICHVKVHFALTTGLKLNDRQRVQVSVYCFLKKKFYVEHRKELPLAYTEPASICARVHVNTHGAVPRKPGVYRV